MQVFNENALKFGNHWAVNNLRASSW